MGFFDQQWAVFAGGEGDFTEAPAQLGGLIFDDGNLPSDNHDDSALWTAEDFTLGFMAQEEEDPWAAGQDPWGDPQDCQGKEQPNRFGKAPRRNRRAASPRIAANADA